MMMMVVMMTVMFFLFHTACFNVAFAYFWMHLKAACTKVCNCALTLVSTFWDKDEFLHRFSHFGTIFLGTGGFTIYQYSIREKVYLFVLVERVLSFFKQCQ